MADQMTNEQLRRAIAEARGWRVEIRTLSHSGSVKWKVLVTPNGDIYETEDGYLPRALASSDEAGQNLFDWCPDWPSDLGDALTLCIEVFGGVTVEREDSTTLRVSTPPNATRAYSTRVGEKDVALGMSSIVLAALRTQVVSHG